MASPVYRSDDPDAPLRLVVLADSTAFTGPTGPLLPDDPLLYPNVAAQFLSERLGRAVTVGVLAHPGSGVRDAWYAVTKDRHVMFEVLMKADAIVVGLGSFDHAPSGFPPILDTLVRAVPYSLVRRRARAALRTMHPWGVRATRGRLTRVPDREFTRLYDGVLHHARALSWGAPMVALGPTTSSSAYWAYVHPQYDQRVVAHRAAARRNRTPFVASWPLVEPFADKLNSDGVHWPFEAHDAIGRAVAAALLPQLTGDAPAPGIPGIEDGAALPDATSAAD